MNLSVKFAALLISVFIAAPALAQDKASEPKPTVSFKNRAIEATIIVDDTLKANPGFYDNLLAEGRREMTKRRAEADAAYKDDAANFDGRRYSFDRKYTGRSVAGRFVSVLRADYYNTLGAHPNREYNTILWDLEAKKRIGIRPLFKETADNGPALTTIAKAIRDGLVAEKKTRETDKPNDPDLDTIKPKLLELAPLLLAPSTEAKKSSGLIVYFSPYMVGSYAEGDYTIFVPWTAFKDHLSPEGAAVFGGDRPPGDDKSD
ncbi:MAG: RsiV family protein [Pseudolabrys sp.]|nr:RsiV family protein [Pseudolabrys sp.]